jgi:hypothetical protein
LRDLKGDLVQAVLINTFMVNWAREMDRLLSIAKKVRPPIQLVGDIGISAALVAVLSTVGWACVGGLDKHGGAFWLMVPGVLGFIELLLAAPLIAVPVYGVAKGRLGFVIGPVFLVMIVYGFSALILKQKEDVFAELTPFAAEAVQDHTLLALDDNDHGSSCDEACIKVLATSNHTLAMRVDWDIWRRETGTPRGWFLYTQIDGTACFARENAKLALNFLLKGFPGKCATKKRISDFDDGLLLRIVRVEAKGHPLPYLPEGFSGSHKRWPRPDDAVLAYVRKTTAGHRRRTCD